MLTQKSRALLESTRDFLNLSQSTKGKITHIVMGHSLENVR